ncbi:MAG: ABC transporter substrate-binding protein [Gammaproteobacteria bacterium]|nr:ABC transporter substrate-binding protein [Gammaproteobacteria bacterium]
MTILKMPVKNRARRAFVAAALSMLLAPLAFLPAPSAHAQADPGAMIEGVVEQLLGELTARRGELKDNNKKLFDLVDRLVVPVFDIPRISKLVLGKNWKRASASQRAVFGEEFKKLMIGSYATALFDYTGKEKIEFTGSKLTERKGRKFAEVLSEVTLSEAAQPVSVNYSLLLGTDGKWRIYNLSIADLNMITHYRATYAASIDALGIDGLISSMKKVNAANYR